LLSRYFIKLSFKGTNYHGWQVQSGVDTVQGILNKALSLILKEEISATGAGRTDSGVHALNFMAHFDSAKKDLHIGKDLKYKLNGFLPPDIFIQDIHKVKNTDHARFNAVSRTYHYIISRQKNPFLKDLCHYIHSNPDINSMNEACRLIKKHNDFTSFSKLNSNNKTNICSIIEAEWREVSHGVLVFRIEADRFLRGMVRAITGTMLDIGSGKMVPDAIELILMEKDRSKSGMSVPAEGLFFTNVKYGQEIIPVELIDSLNPLVPVSYLFFD
jgi:tRNA pseudouridine38-40 synthase